MELKRVRASSLVFCKGCINRTFMELKLKFMLPLKSKEECINRTFMELKLIQSILLLVGNLY